MWHFTLVTQFENPLQTIRRCGIILTLSIRNRPGDYSILCFKASEGMLPLDAFYVLPKKDMSAQPSYSTNA